MNLRGYQQEAVDATYQHLGERDDNPCLVLPTGAGKSVIIAQICKDAVGLWDGRVLIVTHVKELLQQAADKMNQVAPELWGKVGIYSAGLKSRDTDQPIIIAGIQSVFRRADELDAFDLILVDEAHRVPPDGEGMYQIFLNEARKVNPNVRLIGLTATPYRMKSGMLCGPDSLLNHICYEVGVKELIVQGFLSPLVSKASRNKVDTSDLHVRGGEFVASETESLMDTDELVEAACKEILEYTRDRKSVLLFSSGVKHGEHISATLRRQTSQAIGTVFGDTLDFEREQTIEDFRAGRLKFLVNMNVLTTGFDAPNVDCVALLRPTLSPGLYSQMVGRGCRLSPGKSDCLILDFGGNILRHGPIDAIRIQEDEGRGNGGEAVAKECPQCQSVIAIGYSACPDCGFEFPTPEEKKHEAEASDEDILSGQITTIVYDVVGIDYSVHHKRRAQEDAPKTFRVDYRIGLWSYQSEWVCLEHTGYARSGEI